MEIKDWSTRFERAESRKLKVLTWIAMPVGFHSTGYHCMVDEFGDDTAGIYGAWCALCSLAATAPTRGVLQSKDGTPYTVGRIARETHLARHWFEKLIPWAESKGWLVSKTTVLEAEKEPSEESPDEPLTKPRRSAGTSGESPKHRTGHYRTEQDSATSDGCAPSSCPAVVPPTAPPPEFVFPCSGKKGGDEFSLVADKIAEYAESFPGVDVRAEIRAALQWCRDNPSKRKTKRGMPAFLTRWLSKAQNSSRGKTNGQKETRFRHAGEAREQANADAFATLRDAYGVE